MAKLPKAHQFIDLSDYGRPIARWIAESLKTTAFTPIHVTIGFIISGLLGILCIYYGYMWAAAFFLIFKSILDAADGELARVKNTPSYTGRYFDSVADFLLNLLILLMLWQVTEVALGWAIIAFLGIQLQGTLYNYYYVILRNRFNGDTTSRIFEDQAPKALSGESQKTVDLFFKLYYVLYSYFDKTIYLLDRHAAQGKRFPNWFMTIVSGLGLGSQLLMISILLVMGWIEYIIPFFIAYSLLIFVLVGLRRVL